jgi:hypothetical protein
MHSPRESHWVAVKQILHYLKGTISHGLLLKPSSLTLQAFSDMDWVGCRDDKKFTTDYYIFLGESLISWSSKK